MIRVKICGITNVEDAFAAIECGADALGFIIVRGSPRYISCPEVAAIIRSIPSFITTVGVIANERHETVEDIISQTGIDVVQLHGDEQPGECRHSRRIIKAIRVKSLESLEPLEKFRGLVSAFLLDAYTPDSLGGTGQIFNWDIALEAKQFGPIILAGGLNPENIAEAVSRVGPYGVDVSSGVELKRGKKDLRKVKLFIERAKAASS